MLFLICVILICIHLISANKMKIDALDIPPYRQSQWFIGTLIAEIINGVAWWYVIQILRQCF